MRLIDGDAVIADAYETMFDYEADQVENWITSFPVIDAVPVVHGRWLCINTNAFSPRRKCSNCGNIQIPFKIWTLCPICGAKMDLEG